MEMLKRPGKQILRAGFYALLLLAFSHKLAAKVEGPWSNIKTGTSVAIDSTLQLSDPKFSSFGPQNPNWRDSFKNESVTDRIIFSFQQNDTINYPDTFTVWIKLGITYKDEDYNSYYVEKVLSISYNNLPGQLERNQDIFEFDKGLWMQATVLDLYTNRITPPNMLPSQMIPTNLQLEADMDPIRYTFPGLCDNLDEGFISYDDGDFVSKNQITFYWGKIAGAEEYDLEWAYIEQTDLPNEYAYKDGSGTLVPGDWSGVHWNFVHNSTRVTVTQESYTINVIYPRGFIIYRVRGVGRDATNTDQRVWGPWTSDGRDMVALTNFPDQYEIPVNYEWNKNWRYECVYAENGKKKESIGFFDGSLRGRQTVSGINTKQNFKDYVLVQETIYDYYGRAAIQVLPAPYNTSNISFLANFNRNSHDVEFSKEDIRQTGCDPVVTTMLPDNGASRYYSQNNPDKAFQCNKYIPDANGYPFTQVQYAPDNKNRVIQQGMPGLLNMQNHPTKYFYSTPDQGELDILFGTEVGYSSHYTKIVTQDPNGQYTVTYKDMADKVIATAMTGDAPLSMDNIERPYNPLNPPIITKNLLEKNTKGTDGWTLTDEFFITKPGNYTFKYEAKIPGSDNCGLKPGGICYGCVYDLTISILNECGEEQIQQGAIKKPITKTIGKVTQTAGQCADVLGDSLDNFEVNLAAAGNYTVIKTLTINEDSLEKQADSFIKTSDCLLPKSHFKTLLEGQGDCTKGNDAASFCQKRENLMLYDVSPGGQYGEIDDNSPDYEISVFNEDNNLPTHRWNGFTDNAPIYSDTPRSWKTPYFNYKDENGATSYIILDDNGQPDHDATQEEWVTVDGVQKKAVKPQFLTYMEDFLLRWQPSWAKSLLPYHPEHCYLDFCSLTEVSRGFDSSLMSYYTYKDASDAGAMPSLDNLGNTDIMDQLLDKDPFFNENSQIDYGSQKLNDIIYGTDADAFRNVMKSKMETYFSNTDENESYNIWEMVLFSILCSQDQNHHLSDCLDGRTVKDYFTDECYAAAAWKTFRSLYLSYKQLLYTHMQQSYAILNGCYNGCIGNENFDNTDYRFACFPTLIQPHCPNPPSSLLLTIYHMSDGYAAYDDPSQPCYSGNYEKYAKKVRRFPVQPSTIVVSTDPAVSFTTDALLNTDGSGSSDQDIKAANLQKCQDNCQNYVAGWKEKLKECGEWVWQRNTDGSYDLDAQGNKQIDHRIIDEFLQICQEGCAEGHPQGSSTVTDGSLTRKTFEDVLKYYYAQYSATNTGSYKTPYCDADMITMPPAANQDVFSGGPGVDILDKCACDKVLKTVKEFNDAKANNTPLPTGVKTVEDLFYHNYGTPFLNLELTGCTICQKTFEKYSGNTPWAEDAQWPDAANNELKALKIPIGPGLSCGRCVPCKTVSDSISAYNQRNPQAINFPNYPDHLEAALNKMLGMNLSYKEYMDFMEKCQNSFDPDDDTCSDLTPQATELGALITQLFSQHLYLNDFYFKDHTDLQIDHLYDNTRAGHASPDEVLDVHLKYHVLSIEGNVLKAEITDDLGYGCQFSLTLPAGFIFDNISNVNTIKADPERSDVNYTFKLSATYGEQPITIQGESGCWPIVYCQPKTINVCGNFSKMDECFAREMLKLSDKVITENHIGRLNTDKTALNTDFVNFMVQYFKEKYEIWNDAHVADHITFLFDGIFNIFYAYDDVESFNSGFLADWDLSQISDLYQHYSYTVPASLTCKSCTTCGAIETFIGDEGVDESSTNYVSTLQTRVRSKFGENFDVFRPTNPPTNCQNCSQKVYVCEEVNDAGLALQAFLDALVKNGDLISASTDLSTDYYKDPFFNTVLNERPNEKATWKACLEGNKLVGYITYDDLTQCRIELTDESGCHFSSLSSFNSIKVDPQNRGDNYHFVIQAPWSDISITLKGYISCFPIAKCCEIQTDRLCNKPLTHTVTLTDNDCADHEEDLADYNADLLYKNYLALQKQLFKTKFKKDCIDKVQESFTVDYNYDMYHFTLYYYDRAGNLEKTVPPQGVKLLTTAQLATVKSERDSKSLISVSHQYETRYKFTSVNSIRQDSTPDGGIKHYWYDKSNRPVLAQDSNQFMKDEYTYTLYDKQGRAIEVGVLKTTAKANEDIVKDADQLSAFISNGTSTEVRHTFYDGPFNQSISDNAFGANSQLNLRSRVATSTYQEKKNTDVTVYDYATHYSYDEHGNVKQLVQDFPELDLLGYRFFHIEYKYDLISGKVNEVYYQHKRIDQFYHLYSYDADNRLTDVRTSRSNTNPGDPIHDPNYQRDANYSYYLHGPLARLVLGEQTVQGLDYAYNIQGWLKGVNTDVTLDATGQPNNDMSKDGLSLPLNGGVLNPYGRDAYGFTLSYFDNDYQPIAGPNFEIGFNPGNSLTKGPPPTDLYNGNIRAMALDISTPGIPVPNHTPFGKRYHYDQLNRLKSVAVYDGFNIANPDPWTSTNIYNESVGYDANGNILTLSRTGNVAPNNMDDLKYMYKGLDASSNPVLFTYDATGQTVDETGAAVVISKFTNQLMFVNDNPGFTANYPDDIDDQNPGNYAYDLNGNLVKDLSAQIQQIDWNAYGKMSAISYLPGKRMHFRYAPDGNRVVKVVRNAPDKYDMSYTYHVRDAQGNIMATYTRDVTEQSPYLQSEFDACIDAIRTNAGDAAYRVFIHNNFSDNTYFTDALKARLITNSTTLHNVITQFTPLYYAAADPNIVPDVANQFTSNQLASALWTAQKKEELATALSHHDVQTNQVITYILNNGGCHDFMTNYAAAFDGALNYVYSNVIGLVPQATTQDSINYLCANGNTGQMVNYILDLMGAPAYALAHQSNLYNDVVATTGNFDFMKSDLVGLMDMSYLYPLYSQTTTYLYNVRTDLQLLALIYPKDAGAFVNATLLSDISLAKLALDDINAAGRLTANALMNYIHNGDFDQATVHTIITALGRTDGNLHDVFSVSEYDIYGSKRVGVLNENLKLVEANLDAFVDENDIIHPTGIYNNNPTDPAKVNYTAIPGKRSYELTDHLGNVLVTISDKKIAIPGAGGGTDHYVADVLTAGDYYAFGSPMPGRQFTAANAKYRFGFNGQEKDDDVKGNGNQYDFGARIYDPRLGKFLSIDPKTDKYPDWTPYLFAGNNPTLQKDINGEGVGETEAPEPVDKLTDDITVGTDPEFSRKDPNPFKTDGDQIVLPVAPSGSFTQTATGVGNIEMPMTPESMITDLLGEGWRGAAYEKTRTISWEYSRDKSQITITTSTTLTTATLPPNGLVGPPANITQTTTTSVVACAVNRKADNGPSLISSLVSIFMPAESRSLSRPPLILGPGTSIEGTSTGITRKLSERLSERVKAAEFENATSILMDVQQRVLDQGEHRFEQLKHEASGD